jgi:hypothetical protein
MSTFRPVERRANDAASGPSLRLVTAQPARTETSGATSDDQTIELKLSFRELVLVHRSLEAVRTIGLVERQDVLLTDTLQLIDVALEGAV